MLATRRFSQAVSAEERVDIEWLVLVNVAVRINVSGRMAIRLKVYRGTAAYLLSH
jgi:hypothetical protein